MLQCQSRAAGTEYHHGKGWGRDDNWNAEKGRDKGRTWIRVRNYKESEVMNSGIHKTLASL